MKIKIVMHQAEEGGFWAEVPAIPGCATQGDSMEELMQNFMEQLKDAFPSKSRRRNRVALNGCWNCLDEIVIRPRVRSDIERRGWTLLRVSGKETARGIQGTPCLSRLDGC